MNTALYRCDEFGNNPPEEYKPQHTALTSSDAYDIRERRRRGNFWDSPITVPVNGSGLLLVVIVAIIVIPVAVALGYAMQAMGGGSLVEILQNAAR